LQKEGRIKGAPGWKVRSKAPQKLVL